MLDPINRKLLALLRRDARLKYADLGKEANLSPPAVFERVKKLEKSGVIRRYTVDLDPDPLELGLCAFIQIRISPGPLNCHDIARALEPYPEIQEAHSIAGEDCVLAKVRTANTAALDALLQKIRAIQGVERTQTTVVLSTQFERGVTPEG
jgi:Lrp/AsnC family transcriptional regulator, leucine-responsive regulatory protein